MESMENLKFPETFLWGAGISSYQSEGAYDVDGKGLTVQDTRSVAAETADFKVASDFYHHYKEDIALMAEMGIKIFRFSISWARILPMGVGEVNEKGIQFYDDVINTCLSFGIEPLVTLFHFDFPQALAEQGGWLNRTTIDAFEQYATILFNAYGDRVTYWLTINEQNMMAMHSGILGIGNLSAKETMQQNHHMFVAQAKAMKLCHSICPNSKIGPAPNVSPVYPSSAKPEDVLAAQTYEVIRTWSYLDMAIYGEYHHKMWQYMKERDILPITEIEDDAILKEAKPDFIAFNYYNTQMVGAYCEDIQVCGTGDQQTTTGEKGLYIGFKNSNLETTSFGWIIDPVGMRIALNEVYGRYHLPLMITENGIGDYETLTDDKRIHDTYRIEFYRSHIKQMRNAIEDGVEVLAYCPWAALDLISTHQGFKKRYGFLYVNRTEENLLDLQRYKKDSFYWYRNVIASHGTDL
ncbi:glycoside hydrolase family 1 protein [Amedibacillus sp. YH-ame10]